MPTKLEQLKKKIIEVCPDIIIKIPNPVRPEGSNLERKITLEDVLKTLIKPYSCYKSLDKTNKNITVVVENDRFVWILGEPLDEQEPETIDFLDEIICKI